jgi:hypothetical protein
VSGVQELRGIGVVHVVEVSHREDRRELEVQVQTATTQTIYVRCVSHRTDDRPWRAPLVSVTSNMQTTILLEESDWSNVSTAIAICFAEYARRWGQP